MDNSWFKKLFQTNLDKVGGGFPDDPKNDDNFSSKLEMKDENKIVITIGRELGSGGRKVAKEVAKRLGYEYYDKEIITKAAKQSGIDENLFKQVNEADLDNFWFEFTKDAYKSNEIKPSYKAIAAADKLFMIQSDVIRDLAKKSNAVIVGRCSTYILRNESKKIFICANEKDRISRIKRSYKVSEKDAKEIMKKSDEKRESYHSYYTNQNWKDKNNYDLYINTSEVGIEKAINMIIDSINK